jgi:hypothetical protein
MDKQFMPELSLEDRLRVLRDNHKSEQTNYFKQLTQQEMDVRRELLAENSIKYFKLGEELKGIKSDFKERMDPLSRSNTQILHELDTGQAEIEGELFYVPDYEDSMMGVYDANGDLVSSRRLRPEEKQPRLPFIPKAVNE